MKVLRYTAHNNIGKIPFVYAWRIRVCICTRSLYCTLQTRIL